MQPNERRTILKTEATTTETIADTVLRLETIWPTSERTHWEGCEVVGQHHSCAIHRLAAIVRQLLRENGAHADDCAALSRVWKALGIESYTGKSVGEHVAELLAERDSLRTELVALKGECICGHDGKLTSSDCGVHGSGSSIGSLIRQVDRLRTELAAAQAENAQLRVGLKGIEKQWHQKNSRPEGHVPSCPACMAHKTLELEKEIGGLE
jgi:hypothetical protein